MDDVAIHQRVAAHVLTKQRRHGFGFSIGRDQRHWGRSVAKEDHDSGKVNSFAASVLTGNFSILKSGLVSIDCSTGDLRSKFAQFYGKVAELRALGSSIEL